MVTVGMRELRRRARELVRRAQAGESILIQVSGRPAARLVPAEPGTWRRFQEIAELFAGPGDPQWDEDRDRLDARSTSYRSDWV